MKTLNSVLLTLFAILIAGCGKAKQAEADAPEPEKLTIKDVQKVFVHTPGSYSVMFTNPEAPGTLLHSGQLAEIKFIAQKQGWNMHSVQKVTTIYTDASPGKMWVEVRAYNAYYFKIDIHLTLDEISGGGFDYKVGKSSRDGSTSVLR